MPAAKKLRVASEKYEAKAKEKERKELYANFTFLERRITQIYMYISHTHTYRHTFLFLLLLFFRWLDPLRGRKMAPEQQQQPARCGGDGAKMIILK